MTLLEALQDALARIVFAREAVELQEFRLAATVLHNLKEDLACALDRERAT